MSKSGRPKNKKEIKVTVTGTIGEKAKENYNECLARIIVKQYGIEFAKALLECLKNEPDEE